MECIRNSIVLMNIYRNLLVEKTRIVLSNLLISFMYKDLNKSITTSDVNVFINYDEYNPYNGLSIRKANITADIFHNTEDNCFNLFFSYFCEDSGSFGDDACTPETGYFLEYEDVCSIINDIMDNIIH